MRLAISNIAWDVDQDKDVAGLLQRLHVEGVEVAPTKIWPKPLDATREELRRYRRFWESRGIQIVAFQALLFGRSDLTIFDSEQRRHATLDYLGGIISVARELGATALVFGSPKNRSIGSLPADEAWAVAVEFFRRVGERAGEDSVAVCIEPNPPEYGCDFITNSREAVELVRAVGSAGFRVHIDAGALAMAGEQPDRALDHAFPYMHHFHISERHLKPIGTTGVDHAACAKALADLGYRRWTSVEMRQPESGALDAIEEALGQAIDAYGSRPPTGTRREADL